MSTLVIWSANFAIGCFMIGIVIATLRLVRGPDITDRVLALDTMYINGLMLLVALGVKFSVSVYFDIALLLALFGFVGSVAMAKFLLRGEVIER
ncbi:MAG TPA: K+/H+ antiporter subunit F [Burkholderiaceae bacterium]|nr:K+/H+ antiporter subunit F [Burkholderiaceae bacterium]